MARVIAISSAHGLFVRGAGPPYMDEVDQSRRVVAQVATDLAQMGCTVRGPFNDDVSRSQNENLNRIVDWHNAQQRDLDVSVHFNASRQTASPMGTECLYVSQQQLAIAVSAAIAEAGEFRDRGAKKRTDLFFLNKTNKPAILIEVCFVDSKADTDNYHANYVEICRSIAGAISGVDAGVRPPDPPVDPVPPVEPPLTSEQRPVLDKGDEGTYVVDLQQVIGVVADDGDFGPVTDTWVRGFQAACGIGVDGVVGPQSWDEVDDLEQRVIGGLPPLPLALSDQIYAMARDSAIASYSWPGRGVMPPGYIPGMALCFAYAVGRPLDGAVQVMSMAQGSADKDALAWYASEFAALGMSNSEPGLDTLRHLFVMMIGLGPRESSGRYCEGRDMSASNVQADTAEAGLFQTSWNIRSANPAIPPLLDQFWKNPNGFLDQFRENISASQSNLSCYGSGGGARYQFLSRFCPLFHVMVTAVGMRTLRQHWGPINRREVLLKQAADDLLMDVEALMAEGRTLTA